MVDVFISYSRTDLTAVTQLAKAVAAEGYEVWWDADLPPHQSYGDVITARIGEAKAAIVVWSKAAVASQWVRAEADMARNQGKLVQTALDSAMPPLPFNQIQFAEIGDWRGEPDHPGWRKVKASLAELCGPREAAAPFAGPLSGPPPTWSRRRWSYAVAAVCGLLLLVSVAWFAHRSGYAPAPAPMPTPTQSASPSPAIAPAVTEPIAPPPVPPLAIPSGSVARQETRTTVQRSTTVTRDARNHTLVIVNETSQTITSVFISPANSNNWDEDVLGDEVIKPGAKVDADLGGNSQQCGYDVKVVLANGHEIHRRLDLCANGTLRIDEASSPTPSASPR